MCLVSALLCFFLEPFRDSFRRFGPFYNLPLSLLLRGMGVKATLAVLLSHDDTNLFAILEVCAIERLGNTELQQYLHPYSCWPRAICTLDLLKFMQ